MNTIPSGQPISTAQNSLKWPQPLRDEPVVDTFPSELLWRWLIPGIISLAILIVIYGLLDRAANRQIVFLTQNGELAFVRANDEEQQLLTNRVPEFQERGGVGHPSVLPIPHWSPNGRYLAATISDDGQTWATVFPSDLMAPNILTKEDQEWTAVPGNGWSYRSRYLATLTHDGEQSFVAVYDTDQQNYLSEAQPIDIRAGLNWSPREDKLLFTTHLDEMAAPTLRILDVDGNLSNFAPEDNQLMRADGVWSPNGQKIAYIASNTYTDTQGILWGNLWVADSEGQNPRQIVVGHYVFAPFWSPRGDYLYFIRFTKDARFELHRIATSGNIPKEEYVGPGTDFVSLFPYNRNLFAQWSPNNRQLLFLGNGQATPSTYLSSEITGTIETQIRQALPVKLSSQWSPNGRQFAGTVTNGDTVAAFVFDTTTGEGVNYTAEGSDVLVFSANGWSPDSQHVALIRYDGTNSKLTVLDPKEGALGTAGFDLDLKAGFSWHPDSTQIIATSLEEGITTSLKIYDVSANSVSNFEPQDKQLLRADGVWSPDGEMVAYVARDTLTDTLDLDFLAGSLWIADSNGGFAQQLVADGLNLAPIWSVDRRHILFTRFVLESQTFELYQVDVINRSVERLGLSTSEFAEFPFDRQTLLEWSPDGRRWLLPGAREDKPVILYSATANNTNISPFPEQCSTTLPFAVRWAPTGRAVLLACPADNMLLHWTDRARDNTRFPDGLYPSWQP